MLLRPIAAFFIAGVAIYCGYVGVALLHHNYGFGKLIAPGLFIVAAIGFVAAVGFALVRRAHRTGIDWAAWTWLQLIVAVIIKEFVVPRVSG